MKIAGFILLFFLAGCAALPEKIEPLDVGIVSLDALQMGLFKQQFALTLELTNPNDFDIAIDGIRYKLEINDIAFATGVGKEAMLIPRLGNVRIETTASTTLANLSELSFNEHTRYRLKGDLLQMGGKSIPFDISGTVELPILKTPTAVK